MNSLMRRSLARTAITSLALVFVEVAEPVWYTSIGNCSSRAPSATSWAARAMASAILGSSSPSSALTSAAARLISPSARRKRRGKRWPEIGKLLTARCVEAP